MHTIKPEADTELPPKKMELISRKIKKKNLNQRIPQHLRPLWSELQKVTQTTTSEVCLRHGELFEPN